MIEQNLKQRLRAKAGASRLVVKYGSRVGPLLSLLLVVIFFFVYALPPGDELLNKAFVDGCTAAKVAPDPDAAIEGSEPTQIVQSCSESQDITVLANEFASKNLEGKIHDVFELGYTNLGYDNTKNAFAGVAKIYVQNLRKDVRGTIWTLVATTSILALYSLIPGLFGLIYRRNFLGWFLLAFAVLFAINQWGGMGSVAGVKKMPESGWLLVFIVSQLLLLLLAYRLRRYSKNPWIPDPRIYNVLLAVVLVLIGVACYYELGSFWSWVYLDHWLYKWEFMLVALPLLYTLLRHSTHWSGVKPKNIVVCLDGTSNTPEQMDKGTLALTNVYKLFAMLKSDGGALATTGKFDASIYKQYADKQIGFYYSGVGNRFDSGIIGQTLGQASGMGAANVVERSYLDLMRVYRPGDRIYIFGFSRGAAIARLLANAIKVRGAPNTVWSLGLLGRQWKIWQSQPVADHETVPVTVLGCWDTVGAFGIGKSIAGINFQKIDLFKDLSVSENVEQAYHMLALDEQRDAFIPALMDPDPIMPERIIEVWFSGDHANVGGGWATSKLSDVTLDFLLKQTTSGYAYNTEMQPGNEAWGLYLNAMHIDRPVSDSPDEQEAMVVNPDLLGQLRQWSSVLYTYEPRQLPDHAVISETVFQRMTRSTPVYAPQSLFDLNLALSEKRATVGTEVDRLVSTNSLTAEEHSAIMEFKDRLHLTRWPKYWESLSKKRTSKKPEEKLANPPTLESTSQPQQ